MTSRLQSAIRAGLKARGDAEGAVAQQAYMKSRMPYAGLTMPALRALLKAEFKTHPIKSAGDWQGEIARLWRQAAVREERYAAVELLAVPRYRKAWLDLTCLGLIREMIETGAWWDVVDPLAIHHVGALLSDHGPEMTPVLRDWAREADLWVRRSAILAQIRSKVRTDQDLLDQAIQGSMVDTDFFARKAIGWALREYSRTDPDWVVNYVRKHANRLSPLSKREALRVLRKQGRVIEDL